MNRIILNETSYYGAGCRTAIADEIIKRGFKKVLLVTDKDLIKFGVADKVLKVLEGANIPYEVFSEIKPNPTVSNVKAGVEAFAQSGADFIIALGGGSSIDTAKAVGFGCREMPSRHARQRKPPHFPRNAAVCVCLYITKDSFLS